MLQSAAGNRKSLCEHFGSREFSFVVQRNICCVDSVMRFTFRSVCVCVCVFNNDEFISGGLLYVIVSAGDCVVFFFSSSESLHELRKKYIRACQKLLTDQTKCYADTRARSSPLSSTAFPDGLRYYIYGEMHVCLFLSRLRLQPGMCPAAVAVYV